MGSRIGFMNFCPRCGHAYEAADFSADEALLTCSDYDCDYLFDQNSVLYVSAVVPARGREQEVLLIRRGTPPEIGKLALPGGFLHSGELPAEAIAREIREETLVEIRIERRLCETHLDYHLRGERISVLELAFVSQAVDPRVFGGVTEEATSVAFYDVRKPQLLNGEWLAFPEQGNVLGHYLSSLGDR
jgi:ADP-ribose pyrophosphatase YjhB (NUDIX family)